MPVVKDKKIPYVIISPLSEQDVRIHLLGFWREEDILLERAKHEWVLAMDVPSGTAGARPPLQTCQYKTVRNITAMMVKLEDLGVICPTVSFLIPSFVWSKS